MYKPYEIKRVFETKTIADPDEVAECWCAFDGEQQAQFFNKIYEISLKWDAPFVMQLQAITEARTLTEEGRHIMVMIGEYGPKQEEYK
jgi:hypothetical protein